MKKIEIHLAVEYDGEVTDTDVIGLERNVERVIGDGLIELPHQVPSGWELSVNEPEDPPARFTLDITTDNAAFHAEGCHCDDGLRDRCFEAKSREIRRILRRICQQLDDGFVDFPKIFDANGNGVGRAGFQG